MYVQGEMTAKFEPAYYSIFYPKVFLLFLVSSQVTYKYCS